ncbi:class D beta-lactamase [Thiomicrorhabdus heinhorstiae]|uniref:Beta-lactamase n=1 Tax=Thiomicrorhabdus heinhorstiae TaxID=2748010 RepID=A0ABS0BYN8_9GAMM|nr:class D beta-lactamase [Thiomicrorhabdus heinhorstiae]MBF6057076.1 class D beta-lactamase [Thiomicrorhabdus heinhorstiae]
MQKWLVALCLFLVAFSASAEDAELGELFSKQNVTGTLVLSSLKGKQAFVYNETRSEQRFTPASTFKILNTLISVQEKIASGKDSAFKWDGHHYDIPAWNQDQTLQSAFQVSCVWCYQQLAEKIGGASYRRYIEKLHYGELGESFKDTTFWLDGSLKISAVEQIAFLKKVYRQEPPFDHYAYQTLKSIMLVEKKPGYFMEAKTGWAQGIGWYVGYVETANDVWFFALNMDVKDPKKLFWRQELVRQALRLKGIV